MSTILTCGCGDTDKFAKVAFKLLFHKTKLPSVVHTMGVISNNDLRQIVTALTTQHEKYAYYISDELQVWDLIKGVQIR